DVLDGERTRVARHGLRGLSSGPLWQCCRTLRRTGNPHKQRRAFWAAANRTCRDEEDAAGVVPPVSSDAQGTASALLSYAVSRGQRNLHQLSYPARKPESSQTVAGECERELPHLPYRAPGAVL